MIYTHLATASLLSALAALSYIDLRELRLPDAVTLPLIGIGIVVNVVIFGALWTPLIGAILGYSAFVALEIAYRRIRGREGLGRGDAKLLAAGGAWCGAWFLPYIALVGGLSALGYVFALALVRGRKPQDSDLVAFGPWLALGVFVCWLFRAYGPGFPI